MSLSFKIFSRFHFWTVFRWFRRSRRLLLFKCFHHFRRIHHLMAKSQTARTGLFQPTSNSYINFHQRKVNWTLFSFAAAAACVIFTDVLFAVWLGAFSASPMDTWTAGAGAYFYNTAFSLSLDNMRFTSLTYTPFCLLPSVRRSKIAMDFGGRQRQRFVVEQRRQQGGMKSSDGGTPQCGAENPTISCFHRLSAWSEKQRRIT